MKPNSLPRRRLVAYAPKHAFVDKAVSILARLGYRILTSEEFSQQAEDDELAPPRPDLYIVDERRLAEVPEDEGESPIPIIVISGRHGVTGADPRIVGAVRRPAGLHDLFRLLQQTFEEQPRTVPRVSMHLKAVCRLRDQEWSSLLLSLSENGCLLRSPEPLPLGTRLDLSFDLPKAGPMKLCAEAAYQLVPDLGLVFSGIRPSVRDAISGYVADVLLAS
jgi:hypothetical protein